MHVLLKLTLAADYCLFVVMVAFLYGVDTSLFSLLSVEDNIVSRTTLILLYAMIAYRCCEHCVFW